MRAVRLIVAAAVLIGAPTAISALIYRVDRLPSVWLGWIALLVSLLLALAVLDQALAVPRLLLHRAPHRPVWIVKSMLMVLSSVLAVLAVEGGLAVWEWSRHRLEAEPLTMPDEWRSREVTVAGASVAYYWHGKLHVFDRNWMRRTTPFPPRQPGTMRIMVVGDSLTYGAGVAEEQTYCALLQSELARQFRVEVLNLGACGRQSEDILGIVGRFLEPLKPDLVVYGICLNDFLPSEVGVYHHRVAIAPSPWLLAAYRLLGSPRVDPAIHGFFVNRSRIGRLVKERGPNLLTNLGLAHDFYDDILDDFGQYQTRFAADLKQINERVTSQGLPPVVMMVLHQWPGLDSRATRLIAIAEQAAREAGATVVPAGPYCDAHRGRNMSVSRWEGHPSAEAHAVFAAELAPVIARLPVTLAYRRGAEGD